MQSDGSNVTASDSEIRLRRDFFNQPTLIVAKDLLGKFLVRDLGGVRIVGIISEVEAYKGPKDKAAHTFGGRRTARVEPLWGDGGTIYVYLVYGIHWLLNFSTAGEGIPEGVLIRGVFALEKDGLQKIIGPGKVTQALSIGKSLNHENVADSPHIWIEDRGTKIPKTALRTGPRVGIDYAGPVWAAKPWRFWIDFDSFIGKGVGSRSKKRT